LSLSLTVGMTAAIQSIAELKASYQGPDAIPEAGTTTLMIRNLPRSYTVNAMMCELKAVSPRSKYDMIYLPWDVRRGSNISYSFVNFVDHESALRAFFALSGREWNFVRTTKSCRLAAAHIQGLPGNLANYVANFGFQDESEIAPAVFVDGKRMRLKLAVRLFCTDDVLEAAAESVRTKKTLAQEEQVHRQQKTSNQVAMEFKESFQQFCKSIQNQENMVGEELALPNRVDDASDPFVVQFWLRFRDACLGFSHSSANPAFVGMGDSSQEVKEHPFGDANCSRDISASCFAPPPGLARPQEQGKSCLGSTVPDVFAYPRNNLVSHNIIGLKQVADGRVSKRIAKKISFVDSPWSDRSMFSKVDEQNIPVPKWLINSMLRNQS